MNDYNQLSDNFTLEELYRSATATIYHIDNNPPKDVIKKLRRLATEVLQPARDFLHKPFIITSGYRSKELNEKVGGKKNSYHLLGQAADIHCDNTAEGAAIAAALLTSPLTDLVILEKRGRKVWVHVQYSDVPRHKYIQDFR